MYKLQQRLVTLVTVVILSLVIGGRWQVIGAQDTGTTNQPPVIEAIAAQAVDVGQTVMVGLNYSDPDGDTVNIGVSSDNPAATVTVAGNQLAVAGVVAGNANITVTADDVRGGGSSTSFAVTVNEPPPSPAPTNNPPIINSLASQTVDIGQAIVVTLSYSDSDGDAVTVSASSDNTGVATLTQTSATELTVTGVAAGTANIAVTVADDKGGTSSTSFTVTVNALPVPPPTNNPPVIAPMNPQILDVGQSVVVPLGYSDPDGDAVTITPVSDNTDVATVIQSSTLELTVTSMSAGTANITVTVDDGRGGTNSTFFAVTVSLPPSTNQSPIITPMNPQILDVGQFVVVPLGYSDPDGDAVALTLVSDNTGVATVIQSSTVELTVTGMSAGAANVTVTVDDGRGGTNSASFTVNVNAPAVSTPEPTPPPSIAMTSIIVRTVAGLSLDQQQQVVARNGGTEISYVPALRLHFVDVSADTLDATLQSYRSDSQVMSVEVDKTRDAQAVPSDPTYPQQWALPKIGWDSVFSSVTPSGNSVLAILDTGIDASHPELSGLVLPGYSAFDGGNALTDPNGHGTEMAGIAAAHTNNGNGIAGVAYSSVWLMSVQVLAADGTGQDSDIINGMVWATDNGAKVILMAFSNPGYSPALQAAIDYAWDNGVVIVAATGNDSSSTATYPAGDRGVIGVSATDSDDALAALSNYGSSVFMAAPGVNIPTTSSGGSYATISGTSASAAYVAASAAFMRAVDPSLSNGVVVGRLARNADPAGTQEQTGNGRLNLARALSDTDTTSVKPAGAPPTGNGGPFVGPYVVATRNISINDVSVVEGDGAITMVFTVSSTGTGNANVNYSVANGSAIGAPSGPGCNPSIDFLNTSGSFTLSNSTPSRTIPVTICGDVIAESTEIFFVNITTSDILVDGQGIGTIFDNDGVLSINSPSVNEGHSGTTNANFTVSLTPASGTTVTVNYSLTGSSGAPGGVCTSGVDFIFISSSILTFNPGETTKTIPVQICGDTAFETNEFLIVALFSPTNAKIGTSSGQLTIINDDQTITFGALSNKTYGDADFTVSATASSGLTVNFTASGDCTVSGNTVHITGAGSCTITAHQPGNATWTPAPDVSQSFSIAKANQIINFGALGTKTYGDPDFTVSATATSGLAVTFSDNGFSNCTVSGTTVHLTGAGSCTVIASQSGNTNYNPATDVSQKFPIDRATLTVTANDQSREYGDSDPTFTFVYSGFVNGENLATSGVNGSPSCTTTATLTSPVGSYPITCTIGTLASSNYSFSFVNGNLTISEKTVTVTADAQSKVYGEADPTLTYTFAPALITGDSFTGSLSRDAGDDVGTYAITQGTLALSSNYLLVYVGADLTISEKTVTVTADAQSKVYGEADPTLTYTFAPALITGDSFTGSLSRDAGDDVGTYAITQGTLALSSNYLLVYVGADLTISEKTVTVTADAQSKVYGEADPTLTYTFAPALITGDSFTGSLSRDAGDDVGTYAITQGTLALSSNYLLVYVGADLTISEKTVTVTADAQSKVYGEADPTLTYTFAPALITGDSFTGSLSRDAGDDVGTYAITQGTLALSSNYLLVYVGADLTISEKTVTVTADAQSKVYGEADPTLTYTFAPALITGDSFTGSLSRDAGDDVGTYAITQGTLALSSNYLLVYVGADLTISEKTVTVTADAQSKVYGEADPTLTYTFAPALITGDSFTGSLSRDAGDDVGTYAITQGTLALSSNYLLVYVGADLTISEKTVTVTADAQSKVYGEADPTLTYTFAPALITGDSFTGSLSRDAGDDVGTYAITQGTLALSSNYLLVYVGADLTISEKTVTVTADAQSKVYGEADPTLTYTFAPALITGDSFTGSLSRDAGDDVGTYAITQGTLALSSNYLLVYVGADLTISEKTVTVTADAQSKVYGEADPTLTYTFAPALITGDSFTGSLSRDAGDDVGTYAITQGTLALSSNYLLVYVGADLTISEKTVTVTADAQSKVYGEADPTLTYTFAPALITGDSFTGSLSRDAGDDVGTYAITQGTLALSSNYLLVYVGADLTITQNPAITITKSPDLQKVATGGTATFTITVSNTGNVALSNVTVSDLLAPTCNQTFASLAPGASQTYTCTLVVTADLTNVAVVTATPPTGPNVTANDSAMVDVLPKIAVIKTASSTQVLFTGGSVTFTFLVRNKSNELVTITALSDSVFGILAGSPTCKVGTVLPVGGSCSFTLRRTISGAPGTTHRNVFTATTVDNENNSATSTNDAKVYFFWRGRTPGYWKNHRSEWPVFTVTGPTGSTVTVRTTTRARSVFKVPTSYTCITSTDTLLTALGYGGGSTTCNATRILLRAAVAAILNERFFGAAYPPYNSPQAIINAVNAAITTNNRTTIINLANQLDGWNNGIP